MKLFVFDHCPFCVRALLAAGLKGSSIDVVYLLEDDVETPTQMIGKHMVPILEYEAGKYMPESMDIVRYLDQQSGSLIFPAPQNVAVTDWISANFSKVNEYVMPRYAKMQFPEFATDEARQTYIDRHEARVGSFADLLELSDSFKVYFENALQELSEKIDADRVIQGNYSEDDVLLFPLLRALTAVKDLMWPDNLKEYMECLAEKGNVSLYFNQAS